MSLENRPGARLFEALGNSFGHCPRLWIVIDRRSQPTQSVFR